jgi:hypothetical protein
MADAGERTGKKEVVDNFYYNKHGKAGSPMDFYYWDRIRVSKGEQRGVNGWFLCTRVCKGVPKALIEFHPRPDEGTHVEMLSFEDVEKVVQPRLEDGGVVALKAEDHEALLNDIDELVQQVQDMADSVKRYANVK